MATKNHNVAFVKVAEFVWIRPQCLEVKSVVSEVISIYDISKINLQRLSEFHHQQFIIEENR